MSNDNNLINLIRDMQCAMLLDSFEMLQRYSKSGSRSEGSKTVREGYVEPRCHQNRNAFLELS